MLSSVKILPSRESNWALNGSSPSRRELCDGTFEEKRALLLAHQWGENQALKKSAQSHRKEAHKLAESFSVVCAFCVSLWPLFYGRRRMRARMSLNWRLERSFAKTGSTLRFINQISRSSTAVSSHLNA